MNLHFERFYSSDLGKIFLSIILGLGISGLFNNVCDDDDSCIIVKGPSQEKIKNIVYKFNNKCYRYEKELLKCNKDKSIYDFS